MYSVSIYYSSQSKAESEAENKSVNLIVEEHELSNLICFLSTHGLKEDVYCEVAKRQSELNKEDF